MKKFMLGMMVLSVMAFGADLHEVAPQGQKAGMAPKIDFSKAKKMDFVVTKPAQFTIKVPIDVDEVPVGAQTHNGTINSDKQKLVCLIYNNDTSVQFYQAKLVEAGSRTEIMKFNNIPLQQALTIKKYYCSISYRVLTDSGRVEFHAVSVMDKEALSAELFTGHVAGEI